MASVVRKAKFSEYRRPETWSGKEEYLQMAAEARADGRSLTSASSQPGGNKEPLSLGPHQHSTGVRGDSQGHRGALRHLDRRGCHGN